MNNVLSDYYNKEYPEHCRTSCSDERPNNADIRGHGCLRCNAIFFEQAERDANTIIELKKALRSALVLLEIPEDELDETVEACGRRQ